MIVGEVALQDLHRVVAYLEYGDQLHLAHNFVFIDQDWGAEAYATRSRTSRAGRGHGVAGVVPGQPRQAAPAQPLRPRRPRRAAGPRDPRDALHAARARRSSTRARSWACRTRRSHPSAWSTSTAATPSGRRSRGPPRRGPRVHRRRAVAAVRRRRGDAQRRQPGRRTRAPTLAHDKAGRAARDTPAFVTGDAGARRRRPGHHGLDARRRVLIAVNFTDEELPLAPVGELVLSSDPDAPRGERLAQHRARRSSCG